MLYPLLMLQAAATTPAEPPRYTECMDLATSDPAKAQEAAGKWRAEEGGFFARQCLGVAYANQERWPSAAGAFEEAAREAETAHDARAANYWAQSGNAWLAAGDAAKAKRALDAALAGAALKDLALGEAYLDRARALVGTGDVVGGRADLDRALVYASTDPLAWLLSATLARRQNDMVRARKDIAEALKRAGDDAAVQLEAGNIAALSGDEAAARAAWTRVTEIAPTGAQASAAKAALAQFEAMTPQ